MASLQRIALGLAAAATTMVVRKIVTTVLHDAHRRPPLSNVTRSNPSAAAVFGLAISTGALLAVADALRQHRSAAVAAAS
jgi:hypothetical protein